MKEHGAMICVMVRHLRDTQIIILTMVAIRRVKRMDREFTLGPMEKCMTVSGTLD
jgi:hypothetical protein